MATSRAEGGCPLARMMRLLIIPAAGRGSRLGAGRPKPLVHVNGRPMLDHLADLYRPHVDHIVVVAHPSFAAEIEAWGTRAGERVGDDAGRADGDAGRDPAGRAGGARAAAGRRSGLPGPTRSACCRRPCGVWPTRARRPPPPALALPTVSGAIPTRTSSVTPAGACHGFCSGARGTRCRRKGRATWACSR